MSATKLIFKLLFIIIPLLGIIVFIIMSSDQLPSHCSLNVNSTEDIVLSNLKSCATNCWKKHSFGDDDSNDDCSMLKISSTDSSITVEELENIHDKAKVYFDHDLFMNRPFKIILRYNSTGPEISILNYGFCGNAFTENGEMCDGDISTCRIGDFEFGVCSGSKYCSESCLCGSVRDCTICSNLIPSVSNPSIDNDWCRYCNTTYERICDDQLDNDCDRLIDNDDPDCNSGILPPEPISITIIEYPSLPGKFDHTRWSYTIDRLVYHYTVGGLESTLYTLADDPDRQASVHYVLARNGSIYKLVDEQYNAWHAGCANVDLEDCVFDDINPRSIGIEIVNSGYLCDDQGRTDCEYLTEYPRPPQCPQPLISDYWEVYGISQLDSLVLLSADIIRRNPGILVDRTHIIGHDEIVCEKHDPGPAFPWDDIIDRIDNKL